MSAVAGHLWVDGIPLVAEGRWWPVLAQHPTLQIATERLLADADREPWIEPGEPGVYVFQKEFATVTGPDRAILGSDSATTCHILLALSARTAFCAHLDGSSGQMPALQEALLETFANEPKPAAVEVHLIGGFLEERGQSLALGEELLQRLAGLPASAVRLHVRSCCLGSTNTMEVRPGVLGPRLRALAVDWPSRRIRVNTWFRDRGPNRLLRAAHSLCGRRPLMQAGQVGVEDLDWHAWPTNLVRLLLTLNDADLLRFVSTSPDVEHAGFCIEMREVLDYLLTGPG